jgi:hypothetical protein
MTDKSQIFYNVIEQTRFHIKVSGVIHNHEDLGDAFINLEELELLAGDNYMYGMEALREPKSFFLNGSIKTSLLPYIEELEANSKKKSVLIKDQALLDAIKSSHQTMSDYVGHDYGRHGNRIRYKSSLTRKQTKPLQSDKHNLWGYMTSGFYEKYDASFPYAKKWERNLELFCALKAIVGWKRTRAAMKGWERATPQQIKFYRQIWDNPKDYFNDK